MTAPQPVEATPIPNPWSERFSKALADSGFTPVPNAILRSANRLNPRPTNTQLMLIVNLLSHRWRPGADVFPSVRRLARRLGLSEAGTRKAIRDLAEAGYLKRSRMSENRTRYEVEPFLKAIESVLVTPLDELQTRRPLLTSRRKRAI